ncbi:MAG: hypothetical protein ACKO3K_14395 [Cuspidothrix sp.]
MKNKKLVNKLLFWFLLIALVPLSIVTSIQYYIAQNSLTKEVNNNLISIADSKARFLDFYINETEKNAATIAQIPKIIDAIEEYKEAFAKNGNDTKEYQIIDQKYRKFITNYLDIFGYSDIILISEDGNNIFSIKNETEVGRNYYQKAEKNSELAKVFDRAKTLMQVEISNFTYYKSNHEPTAFIAAPIFKENLIIGVVVLTGGQDS